MSILGSLLSRAGLAAAPPLALDEELAREWMQGDVAALRARMSPRLVEQAGPGFEAQLRAGWRHSVATFGHYERVEDTLRSTLAGRALSLVVFRLARGRGYVQLAVDAAGRLDGLHLLSFDALPPHLPAWHPPPYAAHADAYDEEPVQIGAHALPGLLTRPAGGGPFPLLVLVHGSGAGDADETELAIKPFKDLALGLAARGVACLRYVKRARFEPAAPLHTVDDETVDDARAAVALAAGAARIDAARLFLAGHSLGGIVAPRIAAPPSPLAGLVILAGGGRPFPEIVRQELGRDPAAQARYDAIVARLQASPRAATLDLSEVGLGRIPASYWRDLADWYPAREAARLALPMLVLQGDRDIQVRLADFALWQRELAGHPGAVCKRYATLTHLFTVGKGERSDYAEPAAHVDVAVIDDIAAFVRGAGR